MHDQGDLVERLWEARLAGDYSPDWLVGTLDLGQALDVQLALLDRKLACGEELGGWKVGLTSERARTALGRDVRPFGHLLRRRILESGESIDSDDVERPSVEPEMCFVVDSRLEGHDVERDDIVAALAGITAGFEINERRRGSARPDFGAMVTDCLTNWGIVAGAVTPIGDADWLADVEVRLTCNGEERYVGVSHDELDDHISSIGRLLDTLSDHGRGLEPGQKIITGAFCRFDASPGETWRADYSDIGHVEVTFT
jgi:2-keto-4-pentenoate hydratase